MGKDEDENALKVAASEKNACVAAPAAGSERGLRVKDPYAIRAMERVRSKLRVRMTEIVRGG